MPISRHHRAIDRLINLWCAPAIKEGMEFVTQVKLRDVLTTEVIDMVAQSDLLRDFDPPEHRVRALQHHRERELLRAWQKADEGVWQ